MSVAWLAHRHLWPPVMLVVTVVLFMLPVMFFESTEMWDHQWHTQYAQAWYQGDAREPLPHIGYHLLLMAIYPWVGSWQWSGIVIMLACYAATALLAYALLLPPQSGLTNGQRWTCAGVALALLLVAPISVLTWPSENMFFGYIVPNLYHNPTSILLKPIALAQTAMLALGLSRASLSRWHVLAAAALAIASLLAKPNFALCILPAAGCLALFRLYRRLPIDWPVLVIATALPSLLTLGLQYSILSSTRGGVYFAPLESLRLSNPNALDIWPLKVPLSLLFPLVVAATHWRAAWQSMTLKLVWLAVGFALVQFYLLNEPVHPYAGNFWWGAQIALFVLFVYSAQIALRHRPSAPSDGGVLGSSRERVVWGAFALHLLCGVLWWAVHVQGLWAGVIEARRMW